MNEQLFETFDGLFKTLHRQGRRVEELERRVVELERRLNERAAAATPTAPHREDLRPIEDWTTKAESM